MRWMRMASFIVACLSRSTDPLGNLEASRPDSKAKLLPIYAVYNDNVRMLEAPVPLGTGSGNMRLPSRQTVPA